MNSSTKAVTVLLVGLALAGVVVAKQYASPKPLAAEPTRAGTGSMAPPASPSTLETPVANSAQDEPAEALPKLLDLGSKTCIPCKQMEPILAELKSQYAGRMTVEFIDVNENQAAALQHRVEIIPTQVFFSAEGEELYRHVGFYAKEDILAKWAELGFTFEDGE